MVNSINFSVTMKDFLKFDSGQEFDKSLFFLSAMPNIISSSCYYFYFFGRGGGGVGGGQAHVIYTGFTHG